jgi:hypothetical protein
VNVGSHAPASLSFIWRCARGGHCHKTADAPIRARLGSGNRSGDNPGRSYPYSLLPRHGAQRLDQLRQPEEVVVGLHHVVVRVVGVELGRRGEEGVRLAAVEVLLAPVEDDDVALGQHFERHQHALVVLVQPAPDEAHAHVRRQVVELQPVHHAQQVPPLVQVGAGQHADQQPEVGRRGGVIRAQQRAARAHLSSPAARTPWGTRRRR